MKKVFILGSALLLSSSLSFANDIYCPEQISCQFKQGQYQCEQQPGFQMNGGLVTNRTYSKPFTITFENANAGYSELGERPFCEYEIKGSDTHVLALYPKDQIAVIDNSTSDNAWQVTAVVGNVTRYMCNTTNPALCPIKTTESPEFNPSLSF
ncbi:DUF3757 domain-containing protein [Piscirickettsia salmonis]|uniref:DUF3757 domain-containing protein n=1 Tax=Piscirickettsia salmonis TaxID=1238 RepID=UPI0007C8B1F0|nr:hypothetical protein A0O36_00490 [Piscirickettsiaceae bacterium NZ-RLO1]